MRQVRAVGALALLLMSIGTLSAADNPAPAASDTPSTPWYDRVFSSPKATPAEKKEAAVKRPPTPAEVAKSLEQEQKIWFDRVKFCDRLRQIALENNDEALRQKGEKLDNLAFEIYSKKTADLKRIMEEAKAAERNLDDKRTWGETLGVQSTANSAPTRAPNGRLINRSE